MDVEQHPVFNNIATLVGNYLKEFPNTNFDNLVDDLFARVKNTGPRENPPKKPWVLWVGFCCVAGLPLVGLQIFENTTLYKTKSAAEEWPSSPINSGVAFVLMAHAVVTYICIIDKKCFLKVGRLYKILNILLSTITIGISVWVGCTFNDPKMKDLSLMFASMVASIYVCLFAFFLTSGCDAGISDGLASFSLHVAYYPENPSWLWKGAPRFYFWTVFLVYCLGLQVFKNWNFCRDFHKHEQISEYLSLAIKAMFDFFSSAYQNATTYVSRQPQAQQTAPPIQPSTQIGDDSTKSGVETSSSSKSLVNPSDKAGDGSKKPLEVKDKDEKGDKTDGKDVPEKTGDDSTKIGVETSSSSKSLVNPSDKAGDGSKKPLEVEDKDEKGDKTDGEDVPVKNGDDSTKSGVATGSSSKSLVNPSDKAGKKPLENLMKEEDNEKVNETDGEDDENEE